MPVRYVAQTCPQCAGKMEYVKEQKIWRCLYCGAEIERSEQYDGLFTIKNVVKQCLKDTAYRRLDSAFRNLLECEKIDSQYVGTVIAKLAYDMIRVMTPGACPERDVKAVFSQLKRTYQQLQSLGTGVTDDEEALYDFLEESDIFATLLLVYDSLNDTSRRDYMAQLLDASQVYSRSANGSLLRYALKNNQIQLADQIIGNAHNLDPRPALAEVLSSYPDGAGKGQRTASILSAGGIGYEDRRIFDRYLSDTADSVQTKGQVAVPALNSGLPIGLDLLMEQVVQPGDPDTVQQVLAAYCRSKISDEDVIQILAFAYGCGNLQTAGNAMDCLRDSGQYVLVPAKLLIAMLSDRQWTVQNKVALLEKSFGFKIDHKALEQVYTSYLCFNTDSPGDRIVILKYLLDKLSGIPTATVERYGKCQTPIKLFLDGIPTATVERYVLKCTADGANKPDVVKAMFDKGLNTSFFNELLSKYMNQSEDPKDIKEDVVDVLSQKGLKMDPGSFVEYICASGDDIEAKMQFIRKMISNGSQLRADAANAYLERTPPEQFSSELFSLIFTQGSTFSGRAVENYLLWCRDRDAVKAENVKTILDRAKGDVLLSRYQVSHLGHQIRCNLLQAYLLVTQDAGTTARDIVSYLMNVKKMKINAEINVSGAVMKLKKYVAANRANLSPVTDGICQQFRVYSMLF